MKKNILYRNKFAIEMIKKFRINSQNNKLNNNNKGLINPTFKMKIKILNLQRLRNKFEHRKIKRMNSKRIINSNNKPMKNKKRILTNKIDQI